MSKKCVIIGGGISNGKKATANCRVGADIIVVGNAIEKDVAVSRMCVIIWFQFEKTNWNSPCAAGCPAHILRGSRQA